MRAGDKWAQLSYMTNDPLDCFEEKQQLELKIPAVSSKSMCIRFYEKWVYLFYLLQVWRMLHATLSVSTAHRIHQHRLATRPLANVCMAV